MRNVLIAVLLVAAGLQGSAEEGTFSTTLEDQQDIAVTVYNNNRALVRDRRAIGLSSGDVALKFMDVAQQIQPETVSIRSLSDPGKLFILEQNYEYDLMNPQKLMEKYVGKNVRLINKHVDLGFYEVEAKLLSNNGGPIYEIEGDIYLGHPGSVVLPEIPEELIAKPSLIWLLDNRAGAHDVEVTYLTGGMSWKADYVLSLNKESTSLDLEGWVTLNNQSGATYTDAKLKLVAGEVNIVQPQMGMRARGGAMKMAMAEMAPPQMQQESFAEYHLYTLPRRTTIKQNQSKQVSLLTGNGVTVKKTYEYRGNVSYYSQQIGRIDHEKVDVMLTFKNEKENQLGMPLPGGIMRVYQEDREGMLQFAGEDRLQHTPKDEDVRLKLGQAFDIAAERIQTDFKKVSSHVFEAEFTIKIRNHKEEDVVVDVVEPMPADWKVLQESVKHKKKDAHTAIFSVNAPKDEEVEVTYRIRVTY